jgi:hypothetical protein
MRSYHTQIQILQIKEILQIQNSHLAAKPLFSTLQRNDPMTCMAIRGLSAYKEFMIINLSTPIIIRILYLRRNDVYPWRSSIFRASYCLHLQSQISSSSTSKLSIKTPFISYLNAGLFYENTSDTKRRKDMGLPILYNILREHLIVISYVYYYYYYYYYLPFDARWVPVSLGRG